MPSTQNSICDSLWATYPRPPPPAARAHGQPTPAPPRTSTTHRRRNPRDTTTQMPAARLACSEARTARMGSEDSTHRKFYNETDVIKSMESMPEKRIVLTIDPNELKEGVCKIYPSKDEKFAVCMEDEKIKIFPIEE